MPEFLQLARESKSSHMDHCALAWSPSGCLILGNSHFSEHQLLDWFSLRLTSNCRGSKLGLQSDNTSHFLWPIEVGRGQSPVRTEAASSCRNLHSGTGTLPKHLQHPGSQDMQGSEKTWETKQSLKQGTTAVLEKHKPRN